MEHVKKIPDQGAVDDFFYTQCLFAFEHGDEGKMGEFFDRVIQFTSNKNHQLARLLGQR